MTAILLTWNPSNFRWIETSEPHWTPSKLAEDSELGKSVYLDWSCSSSKRPRRGDRAFFIKLGNQGRGIFASGWLRCGSRISMDEDWGPREVEIECDVFLDPGERSNLLDPSGIKGQMWTPQSSGISIRPEPERELERLWFNHIRSLGREENPRSVANDYAGEDIELERVEGEIRERLTRHRSREISLRQRKLQEARQTRGSVSCEVCGFDFERVYGLEYAEVHHIKPLAANDSVTLTKLGDLAVLCANCHRIAHAELSRVKSVEEMQRMIARRVRGSGRAGRAL